MSKTEPKSGDLDGRHLTYSQSLNSQNFGEAI